MLLGALGVLVLIGPQPEQDGFLLLRETYPQLRVSAPSTIEPAVVAPRGGSATFSRRVTAQIKTSATQSWRDRFSVHAEGSEDAQLATDTARFMLQCWEVFSVHLALDHPTLYRNGCIDIFLCRGGTPGGEQRIDQIREQGSWVRVNTIYIYAVGQLSSKVETLRELSHEYGHAVLPAVGGFKTPEDWGNGYLGEKLALTWLANRPTSQGWNPENVMGASREDVRQWVRQHADPLRNRIAQLGPKAPGGAKSGQAAMDAYVGLGLYMFDILPPEIARQSFLFIEGSWHTMWNLFEVSLFEENRIPLFLDAYPVGSKIWIPLPAGWTTTGAKVLGRSQGWAQVQIATQRPELLKKR